MKLVNRNVYYAIHALCFFAQDPAKVFSVSDLVKKLHMQRAFLRRVLQTLSKHGILKSLKGKNGGFILNIQPSTIRIIDIIYKTCYSEIIKHIPIIYNKQRYNMKLKP